MLTTLLLVSTLLSGPVQDAAGALQSDPVVAATLSETELQLALRDLWTGHVFWVRSVVISTHYKDKSAAKSAEAKVVSNARALADAVVPFYGQGAADKLFELLAGHYGAIKQYMEADFAHNERAKTKASAAIVSNAEEISVFLSGANPYLPKDTLMSLLAAHGGHHMAQINAIDQKKFDAEAETWHAMLSHMYTIADAMASALTKQFPDKVSTE